VQSKNLGGLDLYTHSHGGSVAMLANQAGTDVGQMVLLSCPVHWPKYSPDFNHTQKIVSVRVHLDLVILADGGGQRFEDPRIAENVLQCGHEVCMKSTSTALPRNSALSMS